MGTRRGRSSEIAGWPRARFWDVSKGYIRDGGAWDRDHRTPTRLNDDPQKTLRLARWENGCGVVPYADDGDLAVAWRLSEVSVSARKVSCEYVPASMADAALAALSSWGKYDDDNILVVLESEKDGKLIRPIPVRRRPVTDRVDILRSRIGAQSACRLTLTVRTIGLPQVSPISATRERAPWIHPRRSTC